MLPFGSWAASAQLSYLDYNFAESVEDCFYALLFPVRSPEGKIRTDIKPIDAISIVINSLFSRLTLLKLIADF